MRVRERERGGKASDNKSLLLRRRLFPQPATHTHTRTHTHTHTHIHTLNISIYPPPLLPWLVRPSGGKAFCKYLCKVSIAWLVARPPRTLTDACTHALKSV